MFVLFKVFVKKQLLSFQQNALKELNPDQENFIPEISDEMLENLLPMSIQVNPRNLYDFFDENKIFISIIVEDNLSFGLYSCKVNNKDVVDSEISRMKAEQKGFIKCFEILENQL